MNKSEKAGLSLEVASKDCRLVFTSLTLIDDIFVEDKKSWQFGVLIKFCHVQSGLHV